MFSYHFLFLQIKFMAKIISKIPKMDTIYEKPKTLNQALVNYKQGI